MRNGVPLIFGYGGGINSFATLIACRQRDIVPDLVSFSDTGGEKPKTYEHIETVVSPWLRENAFPPLTVVKKESPHTKDKSLEEECLRRETMPSRAFGLSSCAMRWKIEPQEKFLNHWEPAISAWQSGRKPIKIICYDGGELRRASIREDAKLVYWYPLIDWDIDRPACERLILESGLPLPPKSACFYCPSSTKTEIVALSKQHPELMDRALAMEDRALNSQRHTLTNVKGLGRHFSWRNLLMSNDRSIFSEAPVEPCMICHDGESE